MSCTFGSTGSYTMLNTHSSSHQVFDYMLNHDKMYGMRAIRMVPYTDDDSEPVSIQCSNILGGHMGQF